MSLISRLDSGRTPGYIDLVLETASQPESSTFKTDRPSPVNHHRYSVVSLDAYPLAGGWYLFELDIKGLDRALPRAAFHPCYLEGAHGESCVRLPLIEVAPDRYQALARFTHPVICLRLETSAAGGNLDLGQTHLRRMGKPEAAGRLLRAVLRSAGTARKRAGLLFSAVSRLFTAGTSDFAEWLYNQYVHGNRTREYERYDDWVQLYGRSMLAGIDARIDDLEAKPLVSVIVFAANASETWLRRCMDSVVEQRYGNWELCVVADAPSPGISALLNAYALKDHRISVTSGDLLNEVVERSAGSCITFVEGQDELHPLALYWVAKTVNDHPQWKMIYTDEDKIDANGRRCDPYFKPDWNYELLLSQNYLHCLCVFDSELLRIVGGLRNGFDGSEHYDLILRCVEHLRPAQIGHVPIPLYHRRMTSDLDGEQGLRAIKGAVRALDAHLQRRGVLASVKSDPAGGHHIRFHCPAPAPLVSLIVPTRDRIDLLRPCVESILRRSTYRNYELIVVDNGSIDEETLQYMEEISRLAHVKVLRYDRPFNYSAINNFATRHAAGDIVGLVNNDIVVITPDWMEEMVAHAIRPDIGAVGAMLYYPNGTIQHAGVIVGLGGVAGHAYGRMPRGYRGHRDRGRLLQSYSAVTAACMFVRRQLYEAVSGLDEALAVAFNDVDFCLRIRDAGYRNVWTPNAQLYHVESATRGYDTTPEQQERLQGEVDFMRCRWGEALLGDPAYSPNLSLDSHCSDLAFPPRHEAIEWLLP